MPERFRAELAPSAAGPDGAEHSPDNHFSEREHYSEKSNTMFRFVGPPFAAISAISCNFPSLARASPAFLVNLMFHFRAVPNRPAFRNSRAPVAA
jgi:hypothetical protein